MSSLFLRKWCSVADSQTSARISWSPDCKRWSVLHSRISIVGLLLLLMLAPLLPACARRGQAKATRRLRVCADPNNLPFSNRRMEGFENKLAELLAHEMNATLEYTWWAQRRGFLRNTLKAEACDVVIGLPASMEMAMTTAPYYRSSYVFVYRKDRGLKIHSFDDPILRKIKIGVQIIGDDFANTPPAHALSSRKIIKNVVGFSIYGNYAEENPPAKIIDAVIAGDIDVAVVWGPLAGYFARQQSVPLEITAVSPPADLPSLPFTYDISMAVRRGDSTLKDELEQIIHNRRNQIESILNDYGIPRLDISGENPHPVTGEGNAQ
jgi:mxaJ protein